MSLGGRLPQWQVVPSLIDRLEDPDRVVRLAAYEELKKDTGKTFGHRPWASDTERMSAVERWRAWWKQKQAGLFRSAPSNEIRPTRCARPFTHRTRSWRADVDVRFRSHSRLAHRFPPRLDRPPAPTIVRYLGGWVLLLCAIYTLTKTPEGFGGCAGP